MGRDRRVSEKHRALMWRAGIASAALTLSIALQAAADIGADDTNRVFSRHDQDRDGFVSRHEYYRLRQRLRAMRGPQHRAHRMHEFDQIDSDADGLIDRDEVLDFLSRHRQ